MSFIWNFLRRKLSSSREETEEDLLNDVSVSTNVNDSVSTDEDNIDSPNDESFVTSLDELNETLCTTVDEETRDEFSLIDDIYERFLSASNDLDKNAGDLPTGIDVADMTLQQLCTKEDERDTEFKSQKTDDATETESSDQDMPILAAEQSTSEKQDMFPNKNETIKAMKQNFSSILKRKRSYSETYDGAVTSPNTKKLMWSHGWSLAMPSNLPGTSQQSVKQDDVEEQAKKQNLWEEFVAGLDMKCNEAQKLLTQTSQIPKSLPMFDSLLDEVKAMIETLENYPKIKLAGSKLSCTINVLISRQTELEKAKENMMAIQAWNEESEGSSTVSKSDQDDKGSATNNEAHGNVNTAGSILNKITTLAMKALTIYRKMCEAPRLSRKQRRKFEEELMECCNSLKSLEEFIEEANESAYLDALNFCTQTVSTTSPQSKFI